MNKALNKYLEKKNTNSSILCVGIDPNPNKINMIYGAGIQSIKDFCFDLIESTKDHACAYKINFAFFEQFGPQGYELIKTIKDHIPEDIFTIADAKRGDIGNTAKAYAKSIFDFFDFDSITINPYMGKDSVEPFLEYKDKVTIILALTSNPGSADFQLKKYDDRELFLDVTGTFGDIKRYPNWWQIGFVYGATRSEYISKARELAKENLFLVPGVGAQGGSAEEVLAANGKVNVLINVSRGISYPVSSDEPISRTEIKELINSKSEEYFLNFKNAIPK